MTAPTVTVDRLEDGAPVVVKRADDIHGTAAVAHEAEILRRLEPHRGVIRLVRYHAGPPAELVTAWAGDRTLAHGPIIGPTAVATFVADLCDTVAHLHAAGLIHGRLTPDHVIVGPQRQPVICGFARAGPRGDIRADADDIDAVGRLLRSLVDGDVETEPIPERRPRPWRRTRWSGYLRRALLTLADQATADDPRRRPSAAHLAAALRATDPAPGEPTSGRRRPLVAAAGVAGVVIVTGVGMATSSPAPTSPVPPSTTVAPRPAAGPSTSQAPPGPGPPSTGVVEPPPPTVTEPAADDTPSSANAPPARRGPDPSEIVIIGPGRVQVGPTTFRVGEAGDAVAVGDWDCDGRSTLALLRPGTGEVFTFAGWDRSGRGTRGVLVALRHGAIDLDAPADGSCGQVILRLVDGTFASVTLR